MYSKDRLSSEYPKKVKTNQCIVTLDKRNNSSYQISFNIDRKPKTISFGTNELEANRVFKDLCHDLDTGKVAKNDLKDLTGDQIKSKLYPSQKDTVKLTLIETIKTESDNGDHRTILEIWQQYKSIAIPYLAKSTVRNEFRKVDNALSKLTPNQLLLVNVNQLPTVLLEFYSIGTLKRVLATIQRSLNVIVNDKQLTDKSSNSNDFDLVSLLPKTSTNSSNIYYYEANEVTEILNYFNHGESNVKDTTEQGKQYYYPYVLTLAYTGMRPEEAIALRVKDIKINSNGIVQISITKAVIDGIEQDHTKTYKDRLIPCSKMLSSFLIKYVTGKNEDDLLFPSKKGKFINERNFNTRHFKPVSKMLFSSKPDINEYTTYSLRHSFITNMVRQGKDIKTIADYVGNSVKMIIKHYFGTNLHNTEIPDIY